LSAAFDIQTTRWLWLTYLDVLRLYHRWTAVNRPRTAVRTHGRGWPSCVHIRVHSAMYGNVGGAWMNHNRMFVARYRTQLKFIVALDCSVYCTKVTPRATSLLQRSLHYPDTRCIIMGH